MRRVFFQGTEDGMFRVTIEGQLEFSRFDDGDFLEIVSENDIKEFIEWLTEEYNKTER